VRVGATVLVGLRVFCSVVTGVRVGRKVDVGLRVFCSVLIGVRVGATVLVGFRVFCVMVIGVLVGRSVLVGLRVFWVMVIGVLVGRSVLVGFRVFCVMVIGVLVGRWVLVGLRVFCSVTIGVRVGAMVLVGLRVNTGGGVAVGRTVLVGLRVLICACPALAVSRITPSEMTAYAPTLTLDMPCPPYQSSVAASLTASRASCRRLSPQTGRPMHGVPATHPRPPCLAFDSWRSVPKLDRRLPCSQVNFSIFQLYASFFFTRASLAHGIVTSACPVLLL
jgi:hypothetical protein